MNFKTLAIGSVLALGSIFGGVQSAQAETCFDVPQTGGVICNTYQGSNRYGDIYTLGYSTGSVSEGMKVVCDGSRVVTWESYGDMYQIGAQRLANYFCSL